MIGIPTIAKPYPKSFWSHVTQVKRTNLYYIGMAMLTFSLSVQLMKSRMKGLDERKDLEQSRARIELLEATLTEHGLAIPHSTSDEEIAAAAEAEAQSELLASMTNESRSSSNKNVLI